MLECAFADLSVVSPGCLGARQVCATHLLFYLLDGSIRFGAGPHYDLGQLGLYLLSRCQVNAINSEHLKNVSLDKCLVAQKNGTCSY